MKLETLRPAKGSKKDRIRVGRGESSGKGKTSGRGTKGEKSRTGKKFSPGFEGGQTPLKLRLPKQKGFKHQKKYQIINLGEINKSYTKNDQISKQSLSKKGLVKPQKGIIKILANGDLFKSLIFDKNLKFSKNAFKKIIKSKSKILKITSRPIKKPKTVAKTK